MPFRAFACLSPTRSSSWKFRNWLRMADAAASSFISSKRIGLNRAEQISPNEISFSASFTSRSGEETEEFLGWESPAMSPRCLADGDNLLEKIDASVCKDVRYDRKCRVICRNVGLSSALHYMQSIIKSLQSGSQAPGIFSPTGSRFCKSPLSHHKTKRIMTPSLTRWQTLEEYPDMDSFL